MTKKVLIVVRDAPYGSIFAAEALRAGIAFAGMDLDTKLIFVEDGVFCLCKNQKPEIFGFTSMKEGFENAEVFGLKLFAHKQSLTKRDISGKDSVPVKKIDDDMIRSFIEESDTIINF